MASDLKSEDSKKRWMKLQFEKTVIQKNDVMKHDSPLNAILIPEI